MPEASVIEAVRQALREEMSRDHRVFVMGEDVGQRGGVFLATQGLLEEFGGSRVIDMPLAEASIMGIALGAAFRGLRPVPEVQFSDFVWPAVNQLIGEAARTCYGTNGALPVPMVVRIPYGGGIRGGLFHSQNVESLFFHTPGLKVIAPSTPYDAKGLLKSAIRDNNPVIFLEHKKTYRLVRGEVPEEEFTLPIGQAEVKRPGGNATVVSYGLMLHYCLEAAEAARPGRLGRRSGRPQDIEAPGRFDGVGVGEKRPAGFSSSTRTTLPGASAPRLPPWPQAKPSNTWTRR